MKHTEVFVSLTNMQWNILMIAVTPGRKEAAACWVAAAPFCIFLRRKRRHSEVQRVTFNTQKTDRDDVVSCSISGQKMRMRRSCDATLNEKRCISGELFYLTDERSDSGQCRQSALRLWLARATNSRVSFCTEHRKPETSEKTEMIMIITASISNTISQWKNLSVFQRFFPGLMSHLCQT